MNLQLILLFCRYFEMPCAVHKAKIKEYLTRKQQEEEPGKENPGKL
jgi:hypothetical protein